MQALLLVQEEAATLMRMTGDDGWQVPPLQGVATDGPRALPAGHPLVLVFLRHLG